MRILFAGAVLLATASCVTPPPQQQGANCPEARQDLAAQAAAAKAAPAAPAAPTAAAPAPPPAAAPIAPQAAAWFPPFQAPRPGRLALSNFTVRMATVQAFVTPYPDCALHPGETPRTMRLPLNGTWVIRTPPGSDVCWRPVAAGGGAAWNRAFTAAGRFIDARL